MREIKFRVWHNKDKYWVHPPSQEVNLFGEMILLGGFMPVKVEELNDCIPLQFTGLTDKNKKEIYAGDICKYHGNTYSAMKYPEEECEIYWADTTNNCGWMIRHKAGLFNWSINKKFAKESLLVIGNIYENPEL